ncbi:TPA: hypothetical protein DIV55_06900 [Patescibacteria group bacterium]|uniref:Glycogen synthase n=1 Tax=Candidatus Gottesmanbacteria bacterium GW2011_GWA1_43_11 TaxID=1618436 RepID=A0A0G1EQ97_9BACT|nr:MAG: Glycogen synthase [Candidatus Gottesmanbacteria bacterium GW2011_GWA1_43_11]HCS79433.1 hypothetical protein [Patescibacteria group bacterium]
MTSMLVVHVAFECAPIYKTGGLGDVVGSLPVYEAKLAIKTLVMIPAYAWVPRLSTLPGSKVEVLYIDGSRLDKPNKKHDPKIQGPKYAEFCLNVISELKRRGIVPDILHCHDWHTALIPFLLKKRPDPFFKITKTLLTIHNIAYQGKFPVKYFLYPETQQFTELVGDNSKRVNFLKLGMQSADFISTVSPAHAQEIRKGNAGFGLSRVLRHKRGRFLGILNGIDYNVWNPAPDGYVYEKYTRQSVFSGKLTNKVKLQQQLGLTVNKDIPLYGFIARLSSQKGVDLLTPLISELPRERLQLVLLGTGDHKIEKMLNEFNHKNFAPWISVNLRFDEQLAHRIYAASDFFLIPSHYEPCGLTQMISMVYGTIPVASAVGGLVDTIKDGRTGFLLKSTTSESLHQAIRRSLALWENTLEYRGMVARVMKQDFSWDKSATEYVRLYRRILSL